MLKFPFPVFTDFVKKPLENVAIKFFQLIIDGLSLLNSVNEPISTNIE